MKIDLSGKTALVTGSTAGIGHAIARGLAGAGADITVNGRSQGKVDAAVAAIVKAVPGSKVRGVAADVSTAAGGKALVAALPEVDILINNAGIFEPKGFFDIPDEDWTRFFEVNVMSGIRLSRAYMPGMLKRMDVVGDHDLAARGGRDRQTGLVFERKGGGSESVPREGRVGVRRHLRDGGRGADRKEQEQAEDEWNKTSGQPHAREVKPVSHA